MPLKEFILITPIIEAASVLKALETAIPSEAIQQAIGQTHSQQKRQRKLPSELVISLVIAMSLWSAVSMRTVLKNLVNGLSMKWIMLLMWDRGLHSYKMVNATIKQSCHYLGRLPANVKFEVEQVLEDGSYLSWIYPDGKSRKQGAVKIQVRIIEYTIDSDSEPKTYRLITSLMDLTIFPALLLAAEYHQRWEIESTIDELKTHLLGRKTPIRSLKPREVVQEIYGWLLGHWCIRCLMFQAAETAGISPLRIGFTGTLNVMRRAIPNCQNIEQSQLPFFFKG